MCALFGREFPSLSQITRPLKFPYYDSELPEHIAISFFGKG